MTAAATASRHAAPAPRRFHRLGIRASKAAPSAAVTKTARYPDVSAAQITQAPSQAASRVRLLWIRRSKASTASGKG